MKVSKRVFDLVFVIPGLIILFPFFVVVAILIKIDDGGPVFFRQERVGHKGRLFRIWKFRTMVVDAEKKGMKITVGQDSRVTRIGRILRKTKLDEFPQLFNVLLGEMSLVGPRPEVKYYVDKYNEAQKEVLNLVPGITDLASIKYRNESEILANSSNAEESYISDIMGSKISINLQYASKATRISDFIVILKTLSSK
ncbi:MAG TPA: sugar transferase [Chitinophagaceae bacterium]|nr:sugar transferase [Chitinophagaceae bacterium]